MDKKYYYKFNVDGLKNGMFGGWLKEVDGDVYFDYYASCKALFHEGNIKMAALILQGCRFFNIHKCGYWSFNIRGCLLFLIE